MNTERSTVVRHSGLAAVAGAMLWAGGVGAELVHPVEDGSTILNLPLFLAYVGSMAIGTALLVAALAGLRRLHRLEGVELGRAGRFGFRAAAFGMSALVLFGIVYLVAALVTGETLEAAFLLFAIGFLALIVAAVPLAVGLRRGGLVGKGWLAPLGGLAAAVLALAAGADPYHDIGLFLYFGSWVALGASLLARSAAGSSVSSKAAAWS